MPPTINLAFSAVKKADFIFYRFYLCHRGSVLDFDIDSADITTEDAKHDELNTPDKENTDDNERPTINDVFRKEHVLWAYSTPQILSSAMK